MSEQFTHSIIIQGITKKGKTFRPSDWSDRLSGILSSFDRGHRLAHHQYVRPQLINQVRCVIVDKQLEAINPDMFRFLMDFAGDNELITCDGCEASEIGTKTQKQDKPTTDIRVAEITSSETDTAFETLSSVYSHIDNIENFTKFINDNMRPEGYRMIAVFESGKKSATAVCGFRVCHSLRFGACLKVEDWVAGNFVAQLTDAVNAEAQRQGLTVRFLDDIVK